MSAPERVLKPLPVDHPLSTLQSAAEGSLQKFYPAIQASIQSKDLPLDATKVLKASLLQALYNLNDPFQLNEHLQHNSLFSSFMESDVIDWNVADFTQIQFKLLESRILSHFLEDVIKQIGAEFSPHSLYISSNLARWMNKYCPKEVYFHQYNKSPVTEVSCEIFLPVGPHGLVPEAKFFELAGTDFPKRATRKYLESYRTANERHFERSVYDQEHPNEPMFFSDDGQYYVTIYDTAAIGLTKLAPYDNWDTFRERFIKLVSHCKATMGDFITAGVRCEFQNVIELPGGANLSDYFYVVPSSPALIQPPSVLGEESQANYEYPEARTTRTVTKLFYRSDPASLLSRFYADHRASQTIVKLDLACSWDNSCSIDEVPSIANKLKENIYVAFHSFITDKARRLFE